MFLKLSVKMRTSNTQKGNALVLAIFIIVVMTLLGAALVRMISSNAETIAYEVIGTRAYQAAQAGAQKKLGELFPLVLSDKKCDANSTYNFSSIEGLKNCRALDVDCIKVGPTVDDINYYTITSTGQCTVAGVVTSRIIEIKARDL